MSAYNEKSYWDGRYGANQSSGAGSEGAEGKWKRNQIVEAANESKVKSILDLGCGDGQIAFGFLKTLSSVEYLGLDISYTIIEKNLVKAYNLSTINFEVRDISSPSFLEDEYDMALCLDVLFHLSDQAKHDNVINNFFKSFSKVGIISCWNEKILKNNLAGHCFFRKFMVPSHMKYTKLTVPTEPCKDLYIITK